MLSFTGLARGSKTLTVKASDVFGSTTQAQRLIGRSLFQVSA